MKNKLLGFTLSLLALLSAVSCDETTDNVGTIISGNIDHFEVYTDTFLVSTNTEAMGAVLAHSTTSSLGVISDYDTGSLIKCSYLTQFLIVSGDMFPADTAIATKINGKYVHPKTIDEVRADSTILYLYPSTVIGDSLVPLHLSIYELDKPIPDGRDYFSDFDPREEGYLSPDKKPLKSVTFTMADQTVDSATVNGTDYSTLFRIPLGSEYTDKDGVTYKDYGTYIMQKYYENQINGGNAFDDYNKFAHNICPGFFFEIDNGSGAVATLNPSLLKIYYSFFDDDEDDDDDEASEDSISYASTSLFGTDEVQQLTKVDFDSSSLDGMLADNSCTYLKTPAGLFTLATLPIISDGTHEGIFNAEHANDSISCVKFEIPTLRYEGVGGNTYSTPTSLMMIPVDSIDTFQKDNITNSSVYVATYSSSTGSYTFNNCANLISKLYKQYKSGDYSPETWNQVALVPVTTSTTSSGTITAVYHDMSFTSAKLVKGDADDPNKKDNLKLSVIYTKMTNK